MSRTETGHDMQVALEKMFGRPEPQNWRTQYTPEDAEEYAGEVEDLEAQLDGQHPGWRERKPFNTLEPRKLRWVKARLKRRALILEGRGAFGVVVVDTASMPMAVAVKPAAGKAWMQSYRPLSSVPVLVSALGLDRATVEAGLEAMPPGRRDVRRWLREFSSGRGRESDGGPPFPPPIPPAPLARGEA